jgi:hypothetical protein
MEHRRGQKIFFIYKICFFKLQHFLFSLRPSVELLRYRFSLPVLDPDHCIKGTGTVAFDPGPRETGGSGQMMISYRSGSFLFNDKR